MVNKLWPDMCCLCFTDVKEKDRFVDSAGDGWDMHKVCYERDHDEAVRRQIKINGGRNDKS